MLGCVGSASTCWRHLEVVEPDPLQPEQRAWLTEHVQGFHDALHSVDLADPEKGYPAWIDVASFVDYVIVNELSRDLDGYIKSAYLHKDRGGKITAGPLWDFDLAWGIGDIRENLETEGWQYEQLPRTSQVSTDWFNRLMADPAFVGRVAARWRELRGGILSDDALDARIDGLTVPLEGAAARNFSRWNILTNGRLVSWASLPTMPTWAEHVDHLREWTHRRAAWLDTRWG